MVLFKIECNIASDTALIRFIAPGAHAAQAQLQLAADRSRASPQSAALGGVGMPKTVRSIRSTSTNTSASECKIASQQT